MNKGDEERFIEVMTAMEPLVVQANELLKEHKHMLQSQRFVLDANAQVLVRQQKEISDNRAAIEDAKAQAASIINMAQDRAKEIEKSLVVRVAEISHRDRESKQRQEEADKSIWEKSQKKQVKAG